MLGLFMGGAATVAEALAGPLLRVVTIPALCIGGLVATHQYVKARDASLVAKATNVCDRKWEMAIRNEERQFAHAESELLRGQLQDERESMARLRASFSEIETRMAVARKGNSAGSALCLSDGVRGLVLTPGKHRRPKGGG